MSSTLTPELDLYKAVPGTAEPFRTTDINGNWDKVDAYAVSLNADIAAIEADIVVIEADVTAIKSLNTTQNTRLTALETGINGGTA